MQRRREERARTAQPEPQTTSEQQFENQYRNCLRIGSVTGLIRFARKWQDTPLGKKHELNLRLLAKATPEQAGVVLWSVVLRTPELSHLHERAQREIDVFNARSHRKVQKQTRKRAEMSGVIAETESN